VRTVIAGSRNEKRLTVLARAVEHAGWKPSVVLSGTADGVDKMGEAWTAMNGVPVEKYPAKWNTYGKRAGRVRNIEMASHADALIACWDGKSPGTRHMINTARRMGLRVHVERTDREH